jgi:methionyl-tRNA synthetase
MLACVAGGPRPQRQRDSYMLACVAGGEAVPRQIVAGIGKKYAPEELVGKQIAFVANLEPRQLMGLESNGMILAAHDAEGLPVILSPMTEVPSGSEIS